MHPGSSDFSRLALALMHRVEESVQGKPRAVRTAVLVQLAGGHLLVEDVPGVGKTLLARSLAAAVSGAVRRVQFTPDLLPSDITGVSVFHQEHHDFEFRPGPIFANVVIADEINRASAKTQAALLEAMEEHVVSVDGVSHPLPEPFMVIATQNPADAQGTYPLPEAQRDRFMARMSMGYPDLEAEVAMLGGHTEAHLHLASAPPVMDLAQLRELQQAVSQVAVSEPVRRHLVELGRATREHPQVLVGASPRSLVQCMAAARAEAALHGRDYTVPDDVLAVAPLVLPHRLILDGAARHGVDGREAERIVDEVVRAVPAPGGARGRR